MKTLTETGSPQGLVAVVKQSENIKISFQKVLVLENVQDPGNVGTMIRTADAAGYDAVFTSSDTADIYSPKVMRSMQGSNFHLPIFDGIEAALLYDDLKTSGLEILVTTLSDQSVSYKKKFNQNVLPWSWAMKETVSVKWQSKKQTKWFTLTCLGKLNR